MKASKLGFGQFSTDLRLCFFVVEKKKVTASFLLLLKEISCCLATSLSFSFLKQEGLLGKLLYSFSEEIGLIQIDSKV